MDKDFLFDSTTKPHNPPWVTSRKEPYEPGISFSCMIILIPSARECVCGSITRQPYIVDGKFGSHFFILRHGK